MRDQRLQAIIHRKRPSYMITGIRIARFSRESGYHDFIFAYQLYVIAQHGCLNKSISISAYIPKNPFFKETQILDKRQIITCSFRSLQLTRIESLQRSVVKLQIEAIRHSGELPETLKDQIGSALSAYGMLSQSTRNYIGN